MITGYVGIPFRDKGRDRNGVDCWGLVRLVLADHGINLPTYGEISSEELLRVAREVRDGLSSPVWRNVTDEPRRPLDGVVMRNRFGPGEARGHIGIMVSQTEMLHAEAITGTVKAEIHDPTIRNRIIGFYRHKDLP